MLLGQTPTPNIIETARKALLAEAQPIDDIRSTAQYRKTVGANLLEEFLLSSESGADGVMNPMLDAWNNADESRSRSKR